MTVLIAVLLILTAAAGTAVVFTRDPLPQSIVVGLLGLVLSLLFLALMAPEVALAQAVVGAVAIPLMILFALTKVRGGAR